jgi:methyl-accepting chemotaxis protein
VGISVKFNVLLASVALVGICLFWIVSAPLVREVAKDEVLQSSRIMMESAAGARKYTSEQITPLLRDGMQKTFHPQAVSAFAAKKSFDVLHQVYPDFTYREAALNPTNPEDRAVEWEADIINDFRSHPDKHEVSVERNTPMGRVLDLARPLTAKPACLECHSVPSVAPASMLIAYGTQNGFGWQPNEIIGAQIVSVPMAVPAARAAKVRAMFILPFLGIFLLLWVLLNLLLRIIVLRPIARIAASAEVVSLGKLDAPEYLHKGGDEIAGLSSSFIRMQRSLKEAMRMLGQAGE